MPRTPPTVLVLFRSWDWAEEGEEGEEERRKRDGGSKAPKAEDHQIRTVKRCRWIWGTSNQSRGECGEEQQGIVMQVLNQTIDNMDASTPIYGCIM